MALVGEVINEIACPEIPNFELVAPVETVEEGRVPDTVGAADG
jgi:hypothetical protein